MKKIKSLLGILFLSSLILFSCSKDDIKTSESSQTIKLRSKSSVDSLARYFKDVVRSSEQYKESSEARKLLISKFKITLDKSIKTREEFLGWVENNLSNTNFTNVEEAGVLWDIYFSKSMSLFNRFKSFYTALLDSSESEIFVILEPEFSDNQITRQTNSSCETNCLNWVSGAYANAGNAYNSAISGISGWTSIGQYAVALINYDAAIEAANFGFGLCIDNC